jgi:hypothetical protein
MEINKEYIRSCLENYIKSKKIVNNPSVELERIKGNFFDFTLYMVDVSLNVVNLHYYIKNFKGDIEEITNFFYETLQDLRKDEITKCLKNDNQQISYNQFQVNDSIVRIIGIPHGKEGHFLPSENYKIFLKNMVENSDYLLESDFGKAFDLDSSKEMNCLSRVFERLNVDDLEKLVIQESEALKKMNSLEIKEEVLFSVLKHVVLSKENLGKAQKLFSLMRGMPEELNTQLQIRNGGFLKFLTYFSEEMKNDIETYLINNPMIKNLNVLVGLMHQDQIPYYFGIGHYFKTINLE